MNAAIPTSADAAPRPAAPSIPTGRHDRPERQALAVLRRLLRASKGRYGLAIVLALATMAAAAPWIAPYEPTALNPRVRLQGPSPAHLFGTDELGRDIFSRVLFGARISLAAGAGAILTAAVAGTVLGLAAGYYRGWADALLMRLLDTLLAFPAIFLAIGIVAVLGPGAINAVLAVTMIYMPQFARLVRASVLAEQAREYVEAARAMGATDRRIMLGTILPNCLAPVVVQMAVAAPSAIIVEASLAFLGLGTQPPSPSWGAMLQTAQEFLNHSWSYGVFPGLALTLLAVGLNYLGDSLQDALDPRRIRAVGR